MKLHEGVPKTLHFVTPGYVELPNVLQIPFQRKDLGPFAAGRRHACYTGGITSPSRVSLARPEADSLVARSIVNNVRRSIRRIPCSCGLDNRSLKYSVRPRCKRARDPHRLLPCARIATQFLELQQAQQTAKPSKFIGHSEICTCSCVRNAYTRTIIRADLTA
jgi:hypothetical protein